MSDDRIIDFNQLKNKAKDNDVDKFEQYIYNLYYSVMNGTLTMIDFSKKIMEYMQENNISQEKFINIQKKFMERYGMDSSEIENQLKSFGIDPNNLNFNNINSESLNNIQKTIGFYEKYQSKVNAKTGLSMRIKNETNDINLLIQDEIVTITSYKNINLMDAELNDVLLSYRNALEKKIKVIMCENITEYEY